MINVQGLNIKDFTSYNALNFVFFFSSKCKSMLQPRKAFVISAYTKQRLLMSLQESEPEVVFFQ